MIQWTHIPKGQSFYRLQPRSPFTLDTRSFIRCPAVVRLFLDSTVSAELRNRASCTKIQSILSSCPPLPLSLSSPFQFETERARANRPVSLIRNSIQKPINKNKWVSRSPLRRCQLYEDQIYNPSAVDRNSSNNGLSQICKKRMQKNWMAAGLNEFGNNGMISVAWQGDAHNFSYIYD